MAGGWAVGRTTWQSDQGWEKTLGSQGRLPSHSVIAYPKGYLTLKI